ncbi:MAG: zinc ribbon domain-containing protein [Chloroflexi bacterium]|nr:zinc ribbon domain-containing protein [Chloroflexota bacterium]MBI3339590.1 zinc ribbon domain-containing protein [Chloroflexota bacterium]
MDQRIFHGNLKPEDIAQALLAEFNRGNLRAQTLGQNENLAVQIGTRPGAPSGGQTALTVTIQKAPDGILIQLGQQEWLGVATSLGWSALTALRNPFSLISRLDDIAQDVENLQLNERVWQVVNQAAAAMGASHQLSERLSRMICEYCGTANPVGASACIACGAPMGKSQPRTCPNCGFIILRGETKCPNCGQVLQD